MNQTTLSEKMESWFYWIFLLVLFINIWADSALPPHYTIHHSQVSFNRAAEDCSPGVLTTLATEREVADVLKLVSESASPRHQNEFTFWIGLRKVKNQCVDLTLPLRGFKWTEDGSKDSQVSHWTEEPKHTCTTVLCAALKGEFNGSAVTRWGLISVTCKNSYQFICKLRDQETSAKPAAPEPPESAAPEPPGPTKPATTEPPEPATPANPEPNPVTQKPEPAEPEPKLPAQRPKPETDHKPKAGPDPGSEPVLGSESCQRPLIPGARSISLDRNNSSRIQVQCWFAEQLELHCSGRPAVWRLLDDSPANFTTICLPCEDGFQKDTNGDCVDIDECSSGACRHTCLNTEGSFRCFCLDETGTRHDDNSSACAGAAANSVLIPLLVSVATLVVLVVVVTVTVKCCLMKRSKKRAMKKAENMAMKSKDSKDPTV